MSKWVKASDLGLLANMKPVAGLPPWAIEPERYEIAYRTPARVDQFLYDLEVEAIMRTGTPTNLEVLRSQSKKAATTIPFHRREAWRLEMFKENPCCFWCRKLMDIENKTKTTALGRVKTNDLYASFEHFRPRALGGRFTRDNIVLAHAGCNRKRHVKYHLPRYAHDPYRGVRTTP